MPTFKHPCPQCEAFIDRAAQTCPACGFDRPFAADAAARVQRVPATPAPAASAPTTGTVATHAPARGSAACTGCGAALPVGARFCTSCGTLTQS